MYDDYDDYQNELWAAEKESMRYEGWYAYLEDCEEADLAPDATMHPDYKEAA